MMKINMMENESKKSWIVSLILCFFFGIFGIHSFYTKKIKIGIIQLITLGGLGIWALIDLISIINQIYTDKDGNIIRKKEFESEILKLITVFMIISMIVGIIYIFNSLYGIYRINMYKNSDLYKEISQLEPVIQVFLYNNLTQKQIDEIEKNIRAIDGVSTTEFRSKEDALNQMKEKFKEKEYLLEGYDKNNILSASFIVKIKDQSKYEKVYEKIVNLKNIKKVTKNDGYVKHTTDIINNVKVILILFILLIIIVIINVLGKIAVIIIIFKKEILKK